MIAEKEMKIHRLRQAIEAGESSGDVEGFNPVKHPAELNEKYSDLSANQTQ